MRNFLTLLQKEMTESLRNGKWIWLPIAIILVGISQPLTLYYMPQILESSGSLPEGTVIDIPIPSGEEVLASTLTQFGTIGTLLFVLACMSAISMERQNSSLTLVMVRPVSPFQYIASKWASQLIIALVSFIASYVLVWYYTNLLFSPVDWNTMLSSLVIYSLWIVFIISLTILAGTFLKSSSGIAGISISLLGVMSVASGLFTRFMEWSPTNLRSQASGVLMNGELLDNGLLVIFTTVGLSLVFVWLATFNFKRFEQF